MITGIWAPVVTEFLERNPDFLEVLRGTKLFHGEFGLVASTAEWQARATCTGVGRREGSSSHTDSETRVIRSIGSHHEHKIVIDVGRNIFEMGLSSCLDEARC